MGQDKGLMAFQGKPLIQHVVEVMRPLFSELIIVANNPNYQQLGLPIVGDVYPGKGPLGGIYSALKHVEGGSVFVTSCDMPFLSAELINYIMHEYEGAITLPELQGRWQPLAACYASTCLPVFQQLLEREQLKLLSAVATVNPKVVNIHPELPCYSEHLFDNLNTPQDFKNAANLNQT